ncbi:unnamed protein product [Camellia sinensis]
MQTRQSPPSDVPVDMVEDPNVEVQPNKHHPSVLEPQSQQVNNISLSEQQAPDSTVHKTQLLDSILEQVGIFHVEDPKKI